MSDPLDELRSLEGAATRGRLAPAEVRRRGDRMRLRRAVVQAVTAATAVAVIASGGAVVARNLTGADPQPAPAPSPTHPSPTPSPSPVADPPRAGWLTSIPVGFPVDRGLPEPGGDVPEWEWAEGPDAPLAEVACGGTENVGALPVDGLRVQARPPDESEWRHLLLFADAGASAEAHGNLLMSAVRCSEGVQGAPDDRNGPEEVRWSVTQTARGGTVVVDVEGAFYAGGTDVRVPGRVLGRVVRIGNALLVARLDSASSGTGRDAEVRAFDADVEALVEQMCVFSVDGCAQAPG